MLHNGRIWVWESRACPKEAMRRHLWGVQQGEKEGWEGRRRRNTREYGCKEVFRDTPKTQQNTREAPERRLEEQREYGCKDAGVSV